MSLYVVEKLVKDVIVLDLMGQIRLGEPTAVLRQKVKQLVEAGNTRIILDLEDVTYIDSVGLSTLVASYTTTFKAGGHLRLVNLTTRLRDLLQITHLSTVFEVYDSLDAALNSFGMPPAPQS